MSCLLGCALQPRPQLLSPNQRILYLGKTRSFDWRPRILLRESKRQYLLDFQVRRYCLLALQSRAARNTMACTNLTTALSQAEINPRTKYKSGIPVNTKVFITFLQRRPTSKTLCRRCIDAIQKFCVYWDCITFIQRRPNVFDVGQTLYKCYTNVLCLLGLYYIYTTPAQRL